MSEPFIGEMRMTGFNFAPRGWALCDGQILPINQNQSLYSLLGTTYGGDGRTTFALPDLRGRAPMHEGQGVGANHPLGQRGGTEGESLSEVEMPSHAHAQLATNDIATEKSPAANLAPTPAGDGERNYSAATPNVSMDSGATGSSQAHTNMQPYTTINWIIALTGLFPSRN